MDLSKIKMVVTDMDGTLLNSNHQVSNRFFEIFEELKRKNIQFVAASGRQYHSMVDKLRTIQDDVIFVAENGALVKKQEEVLLTTPISRNNIDPILELFASEEDIHPILCSKDIAFLHTSSTKCLGSLSEFFSKYKIVENLSLVDDEILKIAIYHFENAEEYIYPSVRHLEDSLKVKNSGSNWVDISHKNAHKGYAMEKLMQTYGVASDEIMVFGDYNNDLEMLRLSEYSFAMANAHPNVKKVSKFETSSNNDFGVERILEKLI
ncbi:HAD family hydrolase [Flagellimonas eckloniae]|uniref:Haloacid dehalogenase n=1 Tax=Flagellimonas eckloniae TaxID=346185 RepID=A0A0Q0XKL9_9FLAO|nr:HAD family hydrolase [Allomuricauda eckloniae]KQC29513.1 haloacid dehalogenase [Allomuricauda eckloniae]